MTDYHLKPPDYSRPSPTWLEKKEKRKKQLEEVRRRRRVMYELMRKMHSRTA